MPAITLGYSQIEQQIRVIRRRRNWLTVQQAVYVCGGATLLGIALLVVLAVRSERLTFTVAFWTTLTSILLTAIAAIRSIWQHWIHAGETPRWIDRAAALDDRLATLVAYHGTAPPPRLLATLISQLFALRYRWEPSTLVPRRVPHSLYFFLAAIAALIATSFLERPPATPQPFPHVTTSVPHPDAPADAAGSRLARVQGRTTGAAQAAGEGAGGSGTAAPGRLRDKSRSRAGTDDRGAPAPGSQMRAASDGRSGARDQMPPSSDPGARPDQTEPALPDRVQDMIRQALRQPPLDRDEPRAGQERMQAKGGKPGEQRGGNEQQEQHARGAGLPNQGQSLPRPNAGTPPSQPADNAEGGRGSNRGGGQGQGTSGIYGAQGPAAGQENASRKFELKLTLLGQSSGVTMEPQRSQRGGVGDLGIPADQPTTDVPLNPNQRADEPLVRAEIPVEHETMIKRIFSRSE